MSTTPAKHAVNPRTVLLEPVQGQEGVIWEAFLWNPKFADFDLIPEEAFVHTPREQIVWQYEALGYEVW